jgi:hypothetical protein
MPESDDKKVKDLLDSTARAELERWFGLPSFEQLSERGVEPQPPPEDPEFAAIRKRRDDAIAAVDPRLLEAIHRRVEPTLPLIRPRPDVKLNADPSIVRFNQEMLDRQAGIAEPREVEPPYDLADALAERTPQALLRDLHRPETDFYKVFDRVDTLAEYREDVGATIASIMATSSKPPNGPTPAAETFVQLREVRAERRLPWADLEKLLGRVTE